MLQYVDFMNFIQLMKLALILFILIILLLRNDKEIIFSEIFVKLRYVFFLIFFFLELCWKLCAIER